MTSLKNTLTNIGLVFKNIYFNPMQNSRTENQIKAVRFPIEKFKGTGLFPLADP